jgi:hypothetical protein
MRKAAFSLFGCLLLAVLVPSPVSAGGYRMPVTFAGYINRTEVLTNFPVLIVLSNNVGGSGLNFSTQPFLSTNGWDLRIRNSGDSANLDYEIETWNTNGPCYVWVRAPTVATDGSTAILVRWGDSENTNRLPCTTNGAVWDQYYKLVWHLKESGNGTANEFVDSTTNKYHGRGGAGTATQCPTQAVGQVGMGNGFDQTDDYIQITGGLAILANSDFTYEAWLYPQAFVGSNPGGWRDGTTSLGTSFNIFQGNTGRPWIRWSGTDVLKPGSGYSVPSNAWTHAAYTMKTAATAAFLANGDQKHAATHTMATPAFSIYNIGYQSTVGERIRGVYDEVRISTVVRSSNWIWAGWFSQASNTYFNTYDLAGSDILPLINNASGATGVTANAAWLVGVLTSTGASQTAWGVLWGTNNPGATADASQWLGGGSSFVGAVTDPAPPAITNAFQATGLRDNSTYYYTYWATNSAGTNVASPRTFNTLIAAKNGPFTLPITFGGYTNRAETLTNFPALVVFSNGMGGTDFHFQRYPFLSTNGWDLRFKTNLTDTGTST